MSWCPRVDTMNLSIVDDDRRGDADFDPEILLVLAKAGDSVALGRLLERYRQLHGVAGADSGRATAESEGGPRGLAPGNRPGDPPKIPDVPGELGAGVLDVGASDDRFDPGQPVPALSGYQVP